MKEIKISSIDKVFIFDNDDYEKLKNLKFSYTSKRCAEGTIYFYLRIILKKNKHISVHRFILNAPKDKQVDHINGNTLDNRKINLRLCSAKENSRNRKKYKTKVSSYYKGVYKSKDTYRKKSWSAAIQVDSKKLFLGRFISEKEAALAYNHAALTWFGDFAYLNKIT